MTGPHGAPSAAGAAGRWRQAAAEEAQIPPGHRAPFRKNAAADLWRGFETEFCSKGKLLFGGYVIIFAARGKSGFEFTLDLSGSEGSLPEVKRLRPEIAEFFGTRPDLVDITPGPNPPAGKFCHVKVTA